MVKIIEIYELQERDYRDILITTGKFFKSYKEAMKHKDILPSDLVNHFALALDDGSFLLLKSVDPVYLYNSSTERQKRVDELIGKLTPEEYDLLEEHFGADL